MRNEKFNNLIFYEIYPTSFYDSNNDGIGDINGITMKLDYILELGCNALWINPFYLSPFNDGGYDIVDHKLIDPRFGTLDDFKHLLDEAHKRDIKVMVDLVPGHTSEEHPFFIKSGEEEPNKFSNLFIWTNDVWNYNSKYKLISGRHPRNGNYMVNFFSFQPALNFGFKDIDDPSWQMSYKDERTFQARDFIVDIILYWLEVGVDGFRVDMADSLVKNDDSKEATIEVWHYIFNKVKIKYPDAFFVSEWCNPWQAFKAGFDSDFVLDHHDNFYHAFIRADEYSNGPSVLNGGDPSFFLEDLYHRYEASLNDEGYLAYITGNHDVLRLTHYASEEKERVYLMLMFFLPGIPFIYYGDEIGMKYVHLANKDGGYQRVGSRTPMQWDHLKNAGFSKSDELYLPVYRASKVTLEDERDDKDSLFHYIQKLIEIRKNNEVLKGKYMQISEKDKIISITRGELEMLINLSNIDINIDQEIILSSGEGNTLHPYQSLIIRR
ncbi:MAG: glycosylase [Bacilli bacterium]|nr:glycosylase [Bacilli bacterium]